MITILLTLIYLVGAVILIWPVYATVLKRIDAAYPNLKLGADDHFMAGLAGFGVGIFWPACLAVYLAFSLSRVLWRRQLVDDDEPSEVRS